MDIVDEVKAIFDDKNGIIKQLRKEIHSLKIANRDLLDWYNSSREDAKRFREALKEILTHETDYEPYDCIEIARTALKEDE
jgi:hypothetical protein